VNLAVTLAESGPKLETTPPYSTSCETYGAQNGVRFAAQAIRSLRPIVRL